jgi:hypothetical protein
MSGGARMMASTVSGTDEILIPRFSSMRLGDRFSV